MSTKRSLAEIGNDPATAWELARMKRAAKRAADPAVQKRALAHRNRVLTGGVEDE